MNAEIAQRSRTLAGYSAFVAKVREYKAEGLDMDGAMRKAIKYCCEQDILKEFLEQNATEVMNMLMTEWNWDDAKEVWHEEGREEREEEIARKALAKGSSVEFVQEITGLDIEKITALQEAGDW